MSTSACRLAACRGASSCGSPRRKSLREDVAFAPVPIGAAFTTCSSVSPDLVPCPAWHMTAQESPSANPAFVGFAGIAPSTGFASPASMHSRFQPAIRLLVTGSWALSIGSIGCGTNGGEGGASDGALAGEAGLAAETGFAGDTGPDGATLSSDAARGNDALGAGDAVATTDGSTAAPDDATVMGDAATMPACGSAGQVCCSGDTCSAGGCCVDSKCVAAGDACAHALGTCAAGSCGSCGAVGQPCCQEASSTPECTAPGTLCDFANTKKCVACGHEGEPCCDYGGDTCLGPHVVCFFGDGGSPTCTSACGGPAQPCCTPSSCDNGGRPCRPPRP